MDREDKERFLERHRRAAKKIRSHAEEKRLKEEARRRRAERGRGRARERWSGADEEPEPLERMRRSGASPAAPARGADVASAEGLEDALVVGVARSRVELLADGERLAAPCPLDLPLAVGDRVAFERPDGSGAALEGLVRVRRLHPRASWLARPDPGHPERRLVLAANVDLVVCVVAAREPRWKPGFVDRVLLAAEEGRADALVVVNKLDLVPAEERASFLAELAASTALDARTLCLSAATGEGVARLAEAMRGRTCVLVGPSGAGKSSLVAALDASASPRTGAVRASDGKGRHTTTRAELFELAIGARLVDTPGVRELGLVGLDRRGLAASFPDLAPLAAACRFADCLHVSEPGCAVRAAVDSGALGARRYAAYLRIHASLES